MWEDPVTEGAAPGYSWYSPPGYMSSEGDVTALCCLEGSTMSNRVHRNEVKVCPDRTKHPPLASFPVCQQGRPDGWGGSDRQACLQG
ncbi:MAG: hypothetical protein ACI4B5_00005 [Bacteroidaceae bacterium]